MWTLSMTLALLPANNKWSEVVFKREGRMVIDCIFAAVLPGKGRWRRTIQEPAYSSSSPPRTHLNFQEPIWIIFLSHKKDAAMAIMASSIPHLFASSRSQKISVSVAISPPSRYSSQTLDLERERATFNLFGFVVDGLPITELSHKNTW